MVPVMVSVNDEVTFGDTTFTTCHEGLVTHVWGGPLGRYCRVVLADGTEAAMYESELTVKE
jgi:hypothetical protein